MDIKSVPDDFYKVLDDFLRDILCTFPELKENMDKDLHALCNQTEETVKEEMEPHYVKVFKHIIMVLPVRFFDILYENADMFEDEDSNCEFFARYKF